MDLTPIQLAKSGLESGEQAALMAWASMAANFGVRAANDLASYSIKGWAANEYGRSQAVPELARLFAIKNAGHGDVIRGAMARREGVKAGVPDLMLPVTVEADFAALFIELKQKEAGKTSDKQDDWIQFLQQQGYRVEVCHGWEAARDVIVEYLGLQSV